jgi:uncharacterized membrane protein YdjX (TVP38/TMEM64 family)
MVGRCQKKPSCKTATRITLLAVLVLSVVALVVACMIPDSPVLAFLLEVLDWIQALPKFWAGLLLIELYGMLVPFGVPITPLNLVCGFLFGVWFGIIVAITGSGVLSTPLLSLAPSLALRRRSASCSLLMC